MPLHRCDLLCDHIIADALDFERRARRLPQKPLACLVFRRRGHRKRIVLIVNMKRIISDFNGSEAFDLAVAVNVLEGGEVQFFLLEDAIVAKLISRLFLVELVLEYVDLPVKLLQFVEKWGLARRYDNRLFIFRIITIAIAHIMDLGIDPFLFLNRVLLGLYFLFSCFLIELSRHEVFVRMEILIKVDYLVQLHLIFTSLHRIRCEYLRLFLFSTIHLHI